MKCLEICKHTCLKYYFFIYFKKQLGGQVKPGWPWRYPYVLKMEMLWVHVWAKEAFPTSSCADWWVFNRFSSCAVEVASGQEKMHSLPKLTTDSGCHRTLTTSVIWRWLQKFNYMRWKKMMIYLGFFPAGDNCSLLWISWAATYTKIDAKFSVFCM